MEKPTLIILAAGLGSRYGGLKQLAAVDARGHSIIDYSIYDAKCAGFEKIVCVIAPGMEADFRDSIGRRIEKHIDLSYAEQRLDALPQGIQVPENRVKPWGTAHAVLCAKDKIHGPFSAINADDFYGRSAFATIFNALLGGVPTAHVMNGYRIENTLTENGTVSRGVCNVENGFLKDITERTRIRPAGDGAEYTEDGETWNPLPKGTVVSMNMWGFGVSMMDAIEDSFSPFLKTGCRENPLKCEYYLPSVVNRLVEGGLATVRVLDCPEKWYGVTYIGDLPIVRAAIEKMKLGFYYPEVLWPKNLH